MPVGGCVVGVCFSGVFVFCRFDFFFNFFCGQSLAVVVVCGFVFFLACGFDMVFGCVWCVLVVVFCVFFVLLSFTFVLGCIRLVCWVVVSGVI